MTATHREAANARIDVGRKRARWSDEERSIMAAYELEFSLQGVKFINHAIRDAMPDSQRTLEGIKKERQNATYKAVLANLRI